FRFVLFCCGFLNDTPSPGVYTLSLHDALPICGLRGRARRACGVGYHEGYRVGARRGVGMYRGRPRTGAAVAEAPRVRERRRQHRDRKSTRLNSSHVEISYAVFCLKKKKQEKKE